MVFFVFYLTLDFKQYVRNKHKFGCDFMKRIVFIIIKDD